MPGCRWRLTRLVLWGCLVCMQTGVACLLTSGEKIRMHAVVCPPTVRLRPGGSAQCLLRSRARLGTLDAHRHALHCMLVSQLLTSDLAISRP